MTKDEALEWYKAVSATYMSSGNRDIRDMALFISFCLHNTLITQTIKDHMSDFEKMERK